MQASANSATDYNFNGFSINSEVAGTIIFRLYAWTSITDTGWFRIVQNTTWSAYGIASPGLRLTGVITTTAVNDSESNIITTTFDPNDNIDYAAYNAASGLTTANAIKIVEFTIQDGGNDLTDTDAVETILTDLELGITNSLNIAAPAIFDGSTNVSGATTVTANTPFNDIIGVSAPDNGAKIFDIYATFNSIVTDNEQLQLSITSASADDLLG